MKQILFLVSMVFVLSGCSLFRQDCARLADPAAQRHCRAEQGDIEAQYELGLGAFERQDYDAALKWLKRAAAARPGRAALYVPPAGDQQYGRVMMVDTGQGARGHVKAQLLLAEMYARGLGVTADPEQARYWRERAMPNRPDEDGGT